MADLLMLLTAHWIADFVCQSDWMALGKSKRFLPLFVHVGLYTVVMTLALLYWVSTYAITDASTAFSFALPMFALITFVTHFATDYVTSRINSRLWAAKQNHWFFVSVGFDQLIHFYTLAWTFQWCVR